MRLESIMTKVVLSVSPELDAEAAYHEMRKARIHHLVVMDDSRIVGILSERDLGGTHGEPVRKDRTVAQLMTPHVLVAAPETTLREAAKLLRGHLIGCLPVVDGKTLVGIVTTADLLELVARGAERPGMMTKEERLLRERGPRTRAIAEPDADRPPDPNDPSGKLTRA